jgi:hypothetical protein
MKPVLGARVPILRYFEGNLEVARQSGQTQRVGTYGPTDRTSLTKFCYPACYSVGPWV